MAYGRGAMLRGVVEGNREYDREQERQEDRAYTKRRRGIETEEMEAQAKDRRTARSRRDAYEADQDLQDPALDIVSYMEAKADKARQMGDLKTYEEMIGKVDEYRGKNYSRDFDRAMGRFLGTRGSETKGLTDFMRRYWNVESTITRNEDGSFDVSYQSAKDAETGPQTRRFANLDELGMHAMNIGNPKGYIDNLAKERSEKAKQGRAVELERVKGEERRKEIAARGEEARKTNRERPAGGGAGSRQLAYAQARIKGLIEAGVPEADAKKIVLGGSRLPSNFDVNKTALRMTNEQARAAETSGETFDRQAALAENKRILTEGGKAAPTSDRKRIRFDADGNEIVE